MARTQFVDTPDELKTLALKAHQRRDRYILGVVQGQRSLPSKKQARLLRRPSVVNSPQEGRGSLFRYLSAPWRTLSSGQKALWTAAGPYSSLTNWQLFISDNAARIRNSLTQGVAPSELWQVRAGRILIESPASEIILKQEHPQAYIVAQKVAGMPWKQEIVTIAEDFTFPLTLKIRYKSNLTGLGDRLLETGDARLLETGDTRLLETGAGVARYFARVKSSYQGEDIYTDLVLNFDPSSDWELLTGTLSSVRGYYIGYTLFIEISGYRGTLMWDNIEATHGGTNWARDPRCDNVSKEFAKALALVPPFWLPVSLPSGSSFSSVFPPSLA